MRKINIFLVSCIAVVALIAIIIFAKEGNLTTPELIESKGQSSTSSFETEIGEPFGSEPQSDTEGNDNNAQDGNASFKSGSVGKSSSPSAVTSKSGGTSSKSTGGTTGGNFSSMQSRVVELVNQERAKKGISPLSADAKVTEVATKKSEDMASNNYFSHNSPTYGTPFEMLTKFGVKYSAAGENIAKGQTTPESVMNSWMNSQGHRENILNANYTKIGVGIAKTSSGQYVWTQMFIR